MISINEVLETNKMVEEETLDVRTITMGINLLECADKDLDTCCRKIYDKITTLAKDLVSTGEDISREIGIPIVNKRVSITPISLVGGACCHKPEDYVRIAQTLDAAAKQVGVNFLGGYSAVVSKGMTRSDELLIRSIPQAMATTERICSSVNVGSTKTGINMDAVRLMGEVILKTAEATKENDSLGCGKLVVLCNAPDDNPFMAGAFHGVSEADAIINVGVSGPGVVHHVLKGIRGESFEVLCETIKKTAFKITRVGQYVAQEASRRLGIPFGIIDLSLAPTPAIGDSVADILCEIGLEHAGAPGTTAALALLNDQVKKGGVMASSYASASVTPWKAPAMKGLSSGALQRTTSFAQPSESRSCVRAAVSFTISPMRRIASMSSPVLVEPTLTLAQTRSVTARASGIERMRRSSEGVMPFETTAE